MSRNRVTNILLIVFIAIATILFVSVLARSVMTSDASDSPVIAAPDGIYSSMIMYNPSNGASYTFDAMKSMGYQLYYVIDTNTDVVYYYSCSDKKVLMTPVMNADGTCRTASQMGIEYHINEG